MSTASPTPYTALRPMGRGGAASVAAWSSDLDQSVVIRWPPLRAESSLADLLDELDRWSRFRGAGVALPLEAGTDGERVFVTRRFVAGQPLSVWFRAEPRPNRASTLRVLGQVASALAALHRAGLVHGRVTPNNVIVETDPDGRPNAVLTDFGFDAATLAGPTEEARSTDADVTALAACTRLVLVGHPVPAEVEAVLDRSLDDQSNDHPSMSVLAAALERAAAEARRVTADPPALEPPVTSRSVARSTGLTRGLSSNPARLDANVALAGVDLAEMDDLRHASQVRAERWRRRRRLAAAVGGTVLVVGTLVGLVALTRPDGPTVADSARTARRSPVVAIDVVSLRTVVGPREQVQVVIDASLVNRGVDERRCPGFTCRVVLVVGRLTATPTPLRGAGPVRNLAVDARQLGVRTSPRRGSVTVVPMNPAGTTEPLAPRGASTEPTVFAPIDLRGGASSGSWTLVFYVPAGSEVLGAAVLDARDHVLGFSNARDWPRSAG